MIDKNLFLNLIIDQKVEKIYWQKKKVKVKRKKNQFLIRILVMVTQHDHLTSTIQKLIWRNQIVE